jgi:hypothetical protein
MRKPTIALVLVLVQWLALDLQAQQAVKHTGKAAFASLKANENSRHVTRRPTGVATDGSKTVVCDRYHNRVYIWINAEVAANPLPSIVLGQASLEGNASGNSKSNFNWPGTAAIGGNGVLAISDTENDRILLWNQFPTQNGQAADIAIHLPSVTPSNATEPWSWPWGIWTDGKRLACVATGGHTLLVWNTLPTVDNQPPDLSIPLSMDKRRHLKIPANDSIYQQGRSSNDITCVEAVVSKKH